MKLHLCVCVCVCVCVCNLNKLQLKVKKETWMCTMWCTVLKLMVSTIKHYGKYNKTFLQCFVMLFDAILELLQTIIANASIITEMIRS